MFLGYFTIPRTEPVRPIDPGAWVAHTQALRSCESLVDLKHTRGGIVDVEFIVQYLILAYGHEHREFLGNLGNFALLTRAGALGILDEDIAARVAKAYLAYRDRQHRARTNNEQKTWINLEELADERKAVMAAWTSLLG